MSRKLPKAVAVWEKVVALRAKRLGVDHPDTLGSMNSLARGYQATGQLDKAVPLFEETLKLRKAKLGADHPHTLNSIGNLAGAYLDAKQPGKALPLFAELVTAQRQRLGANDPRFAGLLAAISLDLLKARQFPEAEKLLREALSIRAQSHPDAWTTFNTQSLLGGALLGQEKYAEAESLLKDGYTGMKEREKTIPLQARMRLLEALQRLVELYEATGQEQQAATWRKQLEAAK